MVVRCRHCEPHKNRESHTPCTLPLPKADTLETPSTSQITPIRGAPSGRSGYPEALPLCGQAGHTMLIIVPVTFRAPPAAP